MWLKFRGLPIFMVFMEGPIQEFQYPQNDNFLYDLWKKMLWPRISNPTNVIFVQSMKIGTHENKVIHSIWFYVLMHLKDIITAFYTCICKTMVTVNISKIKHSEIKESLQ